MKQQALLEALISLTLVVLAFFWPIFNFIGLAFSLLCLMQDDNLCNGISLGLSLLSVVCTASWVGWLCLLFAIFMVVCALIK